MKTKLYIAAGLVTALSTLAFMPFDYGNGNEDRLQFTIYHHTENGMETFDTIVNSSSSFTIQDFIALKGLNAAEVDILDLDKHKFAGKDMDVEMSFDVRQDGPIEVSEFRDKAGNVVIMKSDDGNAFEIEVDGDAMSINIDSLISAHGNGEKVMMFKMEGDPSTNSASNPQKKVVEVLVEVDEEYDTKDGKSPKVIRKEVKHSGSEGHSEMYFYNIDKEAETDIQIVSGESKEDIQIDGKTLEEFIKEVKSNGKGEVQTVIMEKHVDQDGNVTIEKTVNGEKVEPTAEEMEADQFHFETQPASESSDDVQIWIEEIETSEETESHSESKVITSNRQVEVKVFPLESDKVEYIINDDGDQEVVMYTYKFNTVLDGEPLFLNDTFKMRDIAMVKRIQGENADESESDWQFSNDEAKLPIEELTFYPNPTDGDFRMSFFLPQMGQTNIGIYDLAGKGVYQENLGNFEGRYDQNINLNNLESGTYILRISQNNLSLAEKIIVN